MNRGINTLVKKIAGVVIVALCVSSYGTVFANNDFSVNSTNATAISMPTATLTLVPTAVSTASAIVQGTPTPTIEKEDIKDTEKEFGYYRDSDIPGGITICDYYGNKKNIIIPEKYEGKKVVGFNPETGFGEMKTIFIPKTVKKILPDEDDCHFCDCSHLKAINVDKDNPVYKSVKGMLIDKKNKELLIVPPERNVDKLVIPKVVKKIHAYALRDTAIKVLTIGKQVKKIQHSVACRPNKIILGGGIKVLKEDHFGYQVNIKKLVLKNGVQRIGKRAFASSKKLKKVVIPKSVKYIAGDAFPKGCKVIRK